MLRALIRLQLRILMGLSAASLLSGLAGAAEATSAPTGVREQILRMTDFFDTMLPGVLEENNVTLHFRPKFGDLREEEYMRFPFEVRYGLTNRIELQAGVMPFTPNPINSGRDHRWGLGEAKIGARYDLRHAFKFFRETTVGVETKIPLGNPPVEINDHYTHVKPHVTAARRLSRWKATTLYANMSYDRSVKLTERGKPPPEVIRRHVLEFAPGLLYKPAELGYFTEYRIRHLDEPDGTRLEHEGRVGTIWDVPIARSERFRLPGKWQIELAVRVRRDEGRGTSQGVSARVNWRTTLREFLEHTKVNGLK